MPDMQKHKYTIIFRDKRSNEVFDGYAEGYNWPAAANRLLENFATKARAEGKTLTLTDDFEVLFAYDGHLKQLI